MAKTNASAPPPPNGTSAAPPTLSSPPYPRNRSQPSRAGEPLRSPPEPPGPRTCPPRSVVVSLRIVAPACTLDRLKTPYQTPPCPNKKTGGSLALTPGHHLPPRRAPRMRAGAVHQRVTPPERSRPSWEGSLHHHPSKGWRGRHARARRPRPHRPHAWRRSTRPAASDPSRTATG